MADSQQEPRARHPHHRLRILLVDDDEDEYILTRSLLADRSYISTAREQVGFELEWAPSYIEAMDSIVNKRHDVYLIDYNLGKQNGLELLREAIAMGCRAPMIILTGQGNYDVDLEAMRAGAADYLDKGELNPQLLERVIRYSIERAQLLNSLNERATRDELTGLYNRREINERLLDEFKRYQRLGHPLSLVLFDIDNFKDVNDTYGHQVGDEVLRRIAKLIMVTSRAVDQPARYGGDEFYIILPQTSSDQAIQMAERLRYLIAARPFYIIQDNGRYLRIPVSASMGVACLPEDTTSPEKLVEAADRALYLAKEQGRNCVVAYRAVLNQPLNANNLVDKDTAE